MAGQKRRFSDSAVAFAKRMKMPLAPKRKFIKPSNLGLNQTLPEIKYIDATATDATIVNGTANVDLVVINGLAQGTDNTQRVGRKVLAKALEVNAVFYGPIDTINSGTAQTAVIRWWIICDAQPEGASATATEIWQAGSSYIVDHRNLQNSERFKVLRTGTMSLAGTVPVTASTASTHPGFPNKQHLSVHVPLNDAVKYQGTATGIANISSGAYYFGYCTDYQGTSSGPSVMYNCRFKFTDE